MAKKSFIAYLLNPKNWWLPLLIIFTISIVGVTMIGVHTYSEAPPIPNYVSQNGAIVFSEEEVMKGQAVFQKYALMEYGSMFGDGALRGPDFTAEALHYLSLYMNEYYQSKLTIEPNNYLLKKGVSEQVKSEIKTNSFNASNNTVSLTEAQVFGVNRLVKYYVQKLHS